jgi:hypothetical protein
MSGIRDQKNNSGFALAAASDPCANQNRRHAERASKNNGHSAARLRMKRNGWQHSQSGLIALTGGGYAGFRQNREQQHLAGMIRDARVRQQLKQDSLIRDGSISQVPIGTAGREKSGRPLRDPQLPLVSFKKISAAPRSRPLTLRRER